MILRNGNLTGDAVNTYEWDARNQLATINSGVTASFEYDALGRRSSKTVARATTAFLYDGINVVQELSGSPLAPSANLLTGLGADEIFTRTDSAGTRHLLTDALGSTLGLTDSFGTLLTEYTYEPFGNTIASGQANANPYQFTGRENDGTGLYYYRARYYSPTFQRFISEDPIRFNGGMNLYAYVIGNPVSFTDPFGLDKNPPGRKPGKPSPPPKPPPPPPENDPPKPPDRPPDDEPPIPRPKLPPGVCSALPLIELGGDIFDAAHTLLHPGKGGVVGPGGGFPLAVITTTFHTVFCD